MIVTTRIFNRVHAVHSPVPENGATVKRILSEGSIHRGFSGDSSRINKTPSDIAIGDTFVNIEQMPHLASTLDGFLQSRTAVLEAMRASRCNVNLEIRMFPR